MNTKEKILKYIKEKQSVTGKELSEFLGISRQAVNKHLKELIHNDSIVKEGITRGAVYRFASARKKIRTLKRLKKSYFLQGLEEDKVFQELGALLSLNHELSKGASTIAHYGFTEILNNAIDHSFSDKCSVDVSLDPYGFNFRIRDFGIGIFYSIFTKFNLPDENAVIGELIKGQTTTMKERHSGEGIFFTSKAADTIFFRSHKIKLIFDNLKKDVFVEERKFIKGTEVDFSINRRSKRRLDKIFSTFAPEEFDYRFERTRVLVKLFHQNYVSRSEAKRLLYGLDKFSEIILDFEGVKSMGQGFADELFRVFRNAHPNIILKIENLSPILKPIINHVVDNKFNNLLTIS
jgi:DNA-binding MarR family transcriptional regulator